LPAGADWEAALRNREFPAARGSAVSKKGTANRDAGRVAAKNPAHGQSLAGRRKKIVASGGRSRKAIFCNGAGRTCALASPNGWFRHPAIPATSKVLTAARGRLRRLIVGLNCDASVRAG